MSSHPCSPLDSWLGSFSHHSRNFFLPTGPPAAGERANDDFLAHYGFVPPRNPHDSVALFSDIESAIEWWVTGRVKGCCDLCKNCQGHCRWAKIL